MRVFTNFECLKDNSIMIGSITDKNVNQERHIHEFIEFTYLLEGEMVHYVNGEKYVLNKGSMLIIKEGEVHEFSASGNVVYINLHIIPSKINRMDELFEEMANIGNDKTGKWKSCNDLPRYVVFNGIKLFEVENIFRYMTNEINSRLDGYEMILKECLFLLLLEIKRQSFENVLEMKDYFGSIKLYEIVKYIDENYYKRISLVDIAKEYYCSSVYLGRLFKKFIGQSFVDYIRQKRIDKAIELLITTNKRIEDISLEVGYQEKTQFYILFQKKTGKTPKKFRDDAMDSKKIYNNRYKK